MADRAGFLQFLRAAGITVAALPDNSTYIDSALALSVEVVYSPMQDASPLLYDQAVYNLGTSNLIEMAADQIGSTFFADVRKSFNMAGFMPGVIQASADESTSTTMLVPEFMKNLTLADLQYLKNPWGRAYLAIAQRIGTLWGMT